MNKTMSISVILSFWLLALSCSNKNEVQISIFDENFGAYLSDSNNIPTVKGQILNLTEEEINNITIEYTQVTPFNDDHYQITKNTSLDENGFFELELDYAFPYQQIWVMVSDLYYSGIYVNSDLFLQLNADSLRSEMVYFAGPGINFSGLDGDLNSYTSKHWVARKEKELIINEKLFELRKNRSLEYASFISKYNSLYNQLHQLDDEYIANNPSSFSWLIKNERTSDYYRDLCSYHWISKHGQMDQNLFESIKNHRPMVVSNSSSILYHDLFIYIKHLAGSSEYPDLALFRNSSELNSETIKDLDEYLEIKALKAQEKSYDTDRYKSLFKSLTVLLSDTITKYQNTKTLTLIDSLFDERVADILKLKVHSKNLKKKKVIIENTLKTMKTDWCKKHMKQNFEESSKKLAKVHSLLQEERLQSSDVIGFGQAMGKLPFGANLYHVNNLNGDELLTNIKNTFSGKALILDFWATWCGPCIREMPKSNVLQAAMKDDPIEFVFLCTSRGSKMETWKSKVAELEVSGTHIFVDSPIQQELMDMFSFSAFPSYAFIDERGNYKAGAFTGFSNMNRESILNLMANDQ